MKMRNDEKPEVRAVGKLEAGGELGPIEDRDEYEQRLEALPPKEKELAHESARFADLCRYFADKKMDIPPQVLDLMEGLSGCPVQNRVGLLREASQRLMEYLNDVGNDSEIRQ